MGLLDLASGFENYVIMGLIAVLAALGIYVVILHSEVGEVKAQMQTKTEELQMSQADNQQLRNNITAQNAAIEQIKIAADQRLADKQKELESAHATAQAALVTANNIMLIKPDPKKSLCENSLDLIKETIKAVQDEISKGKQTNVPATTKP